MIYSHRNMISKPCCRASTIEGLRSLLVLFAMPLSTTSVHVNLHSSIMLYTNYDYDKSKIKMEAGICIPSSPKNYHELYFVNF